MDPTLKGLRSRPVISHSLRFLPCLPTEIKACGPILREGKSCAVQSSPLLIRILIRILIRTVLPDMTTTLDRGPVKTLCTHTHSDNLPNPRQRGHHLQMGAQGPMQMEGRGS